MSTLTPWETLSFNCALLRIMEVALAGGHSLRVIGDPLDGRDAFLAVAEHMINTESWTWVRPCPCGGFGTHHLDCTCSPETIERVRRRRARRSVDLELTVLRPRECDLASRAKGEPFSAVADRLERAEPYRPAAVSTPPDPAALALLRTANDKLSFSLDARERTLSVAASIASLSGRTQIRVHDIAEAVAYRPSQGA